MRGVGAQTPLFRPKYFKTSGYLDPKRKLEDKMNQIRVLDTHYLRPDRTVNTILVMNPEGHSRIIYEYNREGIYFKLFLSFQAVFAYFVEDDAESFDGEFHSEEEIDGHIGNLNL